MILVIEKHNSILEYWQAGIEGKSYDGLIQQSFSSFAELFDYLAKPDGLTRKLYGGEWKITVPLAAGVKDVEPVECALGDQTSMYHKESLAEHVALVCANLVDAGFDEEDAVALAVLHDCAKKYTMVTNKRGEISFYGHEKLSMQLAVFWGKTLVTDEEKLRWYAAIIWGHMEALLSKWAKTHAYSPRFRGDFEDLLGSPELAEAALKECERFSLCDEDCSNDDYLTTRGKQIIRGARIIQKY